MSLMMERDGTFVLTHVLNGQTPLWYPGTAVVLHTLTSGSRLGNDWGCSALNRIPAEVSRAQMYGMTFNSNSIIFLFLKNGFIH